MKRFRPCTNGHSRLVFEPGRVIHARHDSVDPPTHRPLRHAESLSQPLLGTRIPAQPCDQHLTATVHRRYRLPDPVTSLSHGEQLGISACLVKAYLF
jgi:hypothetical protein